MFWAERIVGEIVERYKGHKGPIVIRDEKTVSGRIHVGAMRGVVIHGTLGAILKERSVDAQFIYELNDFDALDSVPTYLEQSEFEPHLGKPLFAVPYPGAKSYAEHFGNEFAGVIEQTGFSPKFTWSSQMYRAGKYNELIKTALESPNIVRRAYEEVSGGIRGEGWLPIMMICEQCGKVATTRPVSFDGKHVRYVCDQDGSGAKGCGFEGEKSPFDGNAKLPWKVEWAAKFTVYDVNVEGEGKDLSTKGGARDVANRISTDLFKHTPPFDIRYEFLLIGGKKMSTSKGRGSSAKEISALVPAKIFRLAVLSKDFNQAVNFDPEGDTIPVLYDQYDKLATSYWAGTKDDYARLFELIHPGHKAPKQMYLPRFSQVAFIVQMPHLDVEKEVEKLKGSVLTEADRVELDERVAYAKLWLKEYAPEKFVFELQKTLPEVAKDLSGAQKKALGELLRYIEVSPQIPSGEELHKKLHEIKEGQGIAPAELFKSIYLAFLGKTHGPQAGWFLSALERDFVLKRLKEASI